MDDALLSLPLSAKIALSQRLLAGALDRFGEAFWLAWTGGKDSTLAVWLTREMCRATGRAMPRLLTIDEGDAFPEIQAFQARLTADWGLAAQVAANREILDLGPRLGEYVDLGALSAPVRAEAARLGFTGPGFPFDPESPLCNQLLKVLPLNVFLQERGVAALGVAIRWDEHPARAGEVFESSRDAPPHLRVHPLLHWREADVWAAIQEHGLPFCELYRLGYRSLGTRSGTARRSDLPAWEQDLSDRSGERAGRDPAKEDAMEQLRALGYM